MNEVSYKDPYEGWLSFVLEVDPEDERCLAEALAFLADDTRTTENLERKERYHTKVHLEGLGYEGKEYAADADPEADALQKDEEQRIDRWLRESLTPVQYRRFCLCMDGMTIREIARQESADYSSVNESVKAAQKKLQKICRNTPSEVPVKSPYSGEKNPKF